MAKEQTYKITKYMSKAEMDAVIASGGTVLPHRDGGNVARWVNTPGADFNPGNEKYKVTYTINQKGMDILNNHSDMHKIGVGEAGFKGGVLSKENERGARGIERDLLDKFNKTILKVETQTRNKSGKWSSPKLCPRGK
ncbi:hypothetical protein [Serratia fonticola]